MKKINKVVTLTMGLTMAFSAFAGCGKDVSETSVPGQNVEQADTTKTQLYVLNYNGGVGSDWTVSVKKEFEALYSNWKGDGDKVGVQVIFDNKKVNASGGAIETEAINSRDEVWFTDQAWYYNLLSKGVLADITPAVTGDLSAFGDTGAIKDKFSAEVEDYLNVDGHYYGIPHYSTYPVLTYDKDLFAREKLYFAYDQNDSDDGFIPTPTAKKSLGADGKENTADDGLPITFADFEKLCTRMVGKSIEPILWSGAATATYLPYLTLAMRVCYDGVETEKLRYSFNGTAKGLIDVAADGTVTPYNGTGEAVITADNGYLLNKTAGNYYGHDFLEKVFKNKWYANDCTNDNITHLEAQELFVLSDINPDVPKPIAMFLDGSWWEAEADIAFEDAVAHFGADNAKEKRNFGIMHLPSQAADGKQTVVDYGYGLSFVNKYAVKNASEKKMELIYNFLKFVNTEQQLINFSKTTGCPKGLNYTMGDALNGLSPYAQELLRLKETANVVIPVSSTEVFQKNSTIMKPMETSLTMYSLVNGTLYTSTYNAFYTATNKVSAIQFFNGMTNYWTDNDCYNYNSIMNK